MGCNMRAECVQWLLAETVDTSKIFDANEHSRIQCMPQTVITMITENKPAFGGCAIEQHFAEGKHKT